MWIASPIAVFRFDCSRSYQTKWAAFWSATIDDEKRSVTRDCARANVGSAPTTAAAPAKRRRRRRVEAAGAIDVSPLCIGLVNRSTVSIHASAVGRCLPVPDQAARQLAAVQP